MSASTSIVACRLVDLDTRWSYLEQCSDDRNERENIEQPKYSMLNYYISNSKYNKKKYNDKKYTINKEIKKMMK